MRCPTLKELPRPPAGKTGWPWTERLPNLPGTMPNGKPWPKISIVTPSCNQGQFLEETIRSVLFQGYPNIEYGVMDGGSTDNSAEIIKKYEPWLAWWVSEPDRGQSCAINKGFKRATGEWVAWINSDDGLWPGALRKVAGVASANPDCRWIVGETLAINENPGEFQGPITAELKDFRALALREYALPQPSSFWKRNVLEKKGYLREDLHYMMDHELWVRFWLAGARPFLIFERLSFYRYHSAAKTHTSSYQFLLEHKRVAQELLSRTKGEEREAILAGLKKLESLLKNKVTGMAK